MFMLHAASGYCKDGRSPVVPGSGQHCALPGKAGFVKLNFGVFFDFSFFAAAK
jgi:hypothetical protein